MAGASSWLSQYQAVKSASESLIVAIEDVNDLWPLLREAFEARVPLKKALLFNKAHNSVVIEKLPLEFVLTTDPRLRSRMEQTPFFFRLPYATIVLVTCEDIDDYKTILKPRIKLMVQNEEREYFIVFVTKPNPADPAGKQSKRIYSKLEVDFSSKRRERCCKLELNPAAPISWEEIETRLSECIRNSLERRIQSYDEEFKRLNENRSTGWSFTNLFIMKEGLAFMFELSCLYDDALREYEELEQIYLEIVNIPSSKLKDSGGTDPGDDRAALLDVTRKQVTQFIVDDYFREFDFRQYLFAHQATLLFRLNRPAEVAGRGQTFILSFSTFLLQHQKDMPFCLREAWVITACLSLIEATGQKSAPRLVTPDAEKEFYRLQADLSSLARTKLMRLADLIGYGPLLHRSPCNSALLSMTPWPKPSVWPAIPPDAAARILVKEQALEGSKTLLPPPGCQLTLSPTLLLREANRRRASLSGGSVSEILESRASFKESSAAESPSSMQRSFPLAARPTSPSSSSSSLASPSRAGFDRPMKLAEVHAAAEHEILKLVTHDALRKALTSIESFEEMYLELTRAAADNYHRSRKRHGVVLDGEIASIHHRTGNFDSAAKLYEKVCALYSGDRWNALLAEVLPRLAECQKQLDDRSGYLSSCIKLLSLDGGLLSTDQRKSLQAEVVKVSHSGLTVPVPVDASSLITFCASGPPLELCEGDPGTFAVIVWSAFLDEISLESLSMTLAVASSHDESGKAIKSAESPVLRPGKNSITMLTQPQRPGSYVLEALNAQVGQLKLRSHANSTISAIGSFENDDYLSSERPLRPVLQVSVSRPLVEVKPVVSAGLLVGEPQWIGLVIQPLEYSLKGAVLHITALSGLSIHGSQLCQLQLYNKIAWALTEEKSRIENGIIAPEGIDTLELKSGSIELPDWASEAASVLWLQVVAKRQAEDQSAGVEETARSLNVKLEFGVARSRTYEKTITVNFTDAFRIITRVVAKGNDGTFLLQVTLISQVNASVTILAADLSLQDGLLHAENKEGRPGPSWLFPMVISPNAECALLFVVRSGNKLEQNSLDLPNGDYEKKPNKSFLVVRYGVAGSRTSGAHPPGVEDDKQEPGLVFKNAFQLQMPVLESLIAVGMLPVPNPSPTVGQQVILQWRIQRLKDGSALQSDATSSLPECEELAYEIKSSDSWMIAGRRKGYLSLPTAADSKLVVSVACVPLVAGHVHPPRLDLCNVNQRHISHNPPGPHLVCIFPPAPCYAFCLASDSSNT